MAVIKQHTYEFVVRVKHPHQDRAEHQAKVMRELTFKLASMIHDAKFHNGTTQITPIAKKRVVRRKKKKPIPKTRTEKYGM